VTFKYIRSDLNIYSSVTISIYICIYAPTHMFLPFFILFFFNTKVFHSVSSLPFLRSFIFLEAEAC